MQLVNMLFALGHLLVTHIHALLFLLPRERPVSLAQSGTLFGNVQGCLVAVHRIDKAVVLRFILTQPAHQIFGGCVEEVKAE